MADSVLTRDGPVSVPLDYVVPQGGELLPLTVRATVDGSGAGQAFYAVVQVISPSGRVMGNYISQALAAGASADVTWFLGANLTSAAASALPVTESFYVDTRSSTGATSNTVLASGSTYLVSVQGTYSLWNTAITNGAPEANAQYPTSGGLARASTEVGLDAETCFANPTPVVPPPAIGHVAYMQFDLGSGFSHHEPFDGVHTTPAPGHFYSYSLVGQGQPLKCFMSDPGGAGQYADNYGNFLVTIYAVPGAGAGTISTLTSSGSTVTVSNPSGPTTNIDLPASGVTANTYGDASHVARVTVNAEGIVTSASSVAIGGLSGSGLVLLYDSTLGADSATFDTGAGGIASGHVHLVAFLTARMSDAALVGDVGLRFNNDSGTNYNYTTMQAFNGAPNAGNSAAQSSMQVTSMPGATSTASVFGTCTLHIPDYEGSQLKTFNATGGAPPSWWIGQAIGYWNNTAAITRIQLVDRTGGNFKAGSRLTIYGTA